MIKYENDHVTLDGTGADLLAGLSCIVSSLNETLIESGIRKTNVRHLILSTVNVGLDDKDEKEEPKEEAQAETKAEPESVKHCDSCRGGFMKDALLPLLILAILSGGSDHGKD